MKKIQYQAPEMEIVEIELGGNVLLEASPSGNQPGFDDNPGDGGDAA